MVWREGVWQKTPVPRSGFTHDGQLWDVHCVSAVDCMAVGEFQLSGVPGDEPYLLHWDGVAWTRLKNKVPQKLDPVVTSVSCDAAGDCFAVGYLERYPRQPLFLRWDGSTWVRVPPMKTLRPGGGALFGIECTEAGNCIAVGNTNDNRGRSLPLVANLVGDNWRSRPLAIEPVPSSSFLSSTACSGPRACVALGSVQPAGVGEAQTLFATLARARWSRGPQPPTVGADIRVGLSGVDCMADGICIAVGAGWHKLYRPQSRAMALSWNGSDWARMDTASDPATIPARAFYDVSCFGSACVAVGADHGVRAMAQLWDGVAWQLMDMPPTS